LQLYSAVIAMFINIPLAIVFTRYFGLGVEGVILSTCVSLSLFAVVGPLEVYSILRIKTS
jgi:Na+-driven multidrug efflux pump